MALTVKNPEVERLARPERPRSEVIEESLSEMQDLLPKGRRPTKEEEILGFGPEGF